VLKCATIVSITTKVEQDLPLKMIQAAFDWDRSAYERVLSPEFYTFRKAVVDPPPLDFDPIGQNWEDSNNHPKPPVVGRPVLDRLQVQWPLRIELGSDGYSPNWVSREGHPHWNPRSGRAPRSRASSRAAFVLGTGPPRSPPALLGIGGWCPSPPRPPRSTHHG